MSLDTVVTRARAAQEKLFVDTGSVYRIIGEPTWDSDEGDVVTPTTITYSGRCRVLPDSNRSTDDADAAETLIGTPDFTIRFPVDSDVRRDDVVVIESCTYDPAMVGKQYVIRKAQNDGRQFARICVAEEFLAPAAEGGS